MKIIKLLEINAVDNKAKIIDINICKQINDYINKHLSENIKYIEKKNKIKVNFKIDNTLIIPDYKIELKNKSKKIITTIEEISKLEYIQEKTNNVVNLTQKRSKSLYKKNGWPDEGGLAFMISHKPSTHGSQEIGKFLSTPKVYIKN